MREERRTLKINWAADCLQREAAKNRLEVGLIYENN